MKRCTKCGEQKDQEAFGLKKGRRKPTCRRCDAKYRQEYRTLNLEKCRAAGRAAEARRRQNPEKRARMIGIQKRSYHEKGGKARSVSYLAKLKEADFFRWKARRSYVLLTAEELRALWDRQAGKCALTGRVLTPAEAELDHIIPKTRGGGDEMENMRWLCREANQAKRSMLDAEFLALCQEVAAYSEWIGRQALEHIGR